MKIPDPSLFRDEDGDPKPIYKADAYASFIHDMAKIMEHHRDPANDKEHLSPLVNDICGAIVFEVTAGSIASSIGPMLSSGSWDLLKHVVRETHALQFLWRSSLMFIPDAEGDAQIAEHKDLVTSFSPWFANLFFYQPALPLVLAILQVVRAWQMTHTLLNLREVDPVQRIKAKDTLETIMNRTKNVFTKGIPPAALYTPRAFGKFLQSAQKDIFEAVCDHAGIFAHLLTQLLGSKVVARRSEKTFESNKDEIECLTVGLDFGDDPEDLATSVLKHIGTSATIRRTTPVPPLYLTNPLAPTTGGTP